MSDWPSLVAREFSGELQRGRVAAGCVPAGRPAAVTVFLLKSDDLDAWARTASPDTWIDRGHKHRKRPLSVYLGGNGRCVLLRADYCDPGQAERGVRALLTASAQRHRHGVMLLGIGGTLFDQLWGRASDAPPADAAIPEPPAPAPVAVGDDELGRLLDGNPDLVVPASLCERYVGSAPVVERVRKLIVLAARSPHPVLIEGASGTGKEIVARQIHELGIHPTESFIPVNCGGISEYLLESELFGHVKGSFTGAVGDKVGLWKKADAGTLFLDEIGDMTPYHQAKVLRALEDGKFRPVGGEAEVTSHARVIAATHRDLRSMVADGRFREDLYYRLFALRIRTPSLSEHAQDVPLLAAHLWPRLAGPDAPPLPADALAALQAIAWPGNVRELRAFLINLSVVADRRPVTAAMVRALVRERRGT